MLVALRAQKLSFFVMPQMSCYGAFCVLYPLCMCSDPTEKSTRYEILEEKLNAYWRIWH